MDEKGTVFFPEPYLEATPKNYGMNQYEDVFFPALDNTRLHGWFVHGPDDRAVLLWFHGNAGNVSHRLDNLERLHQALHLPIFIFDYREYGLSEGKISKEGTFSDARGAFRYLTEQRGFARSSILLFGRSLGTALAVDIASVHDCLGVILEAAFTSTDDMMQPRFARESPLSSPIKYDNLSLIDRIQVPILFIHGQKDQIIPISMSRRLYDRTVASKYFYEIPEASHNDTYEIGGDEYFEVLENFLESCLNHRKYKNAGGFDY